MHIICENFRTDVKVGVRSLCDLVVEPLGVRLLLCTLFISGTRGWVELPSRQYQSKGKTRWALTINFTTRSTYEWFQFVALGAIRPFRDQSKQPTASPQFVGAVE
jgi:hypothetical protein